MVKSDGADEQFHIMLANIPTKAPACWESANIQWWWTKPEPIQTSAEKTMYCVARRCYCFLLYVLSTEQSPNMSKKHEGENAALYAHGIFRMRVTKQQLAKGNKHSSGEEWRADKAVHSIPSSAGGNRLASLSSEQQRAQGSNLRGTNYIMLNGFLSLLFSRLAVRRHRSAFAFREHCFVWENGRLLPFFSLFHLSDHRGRDPLALQPHSSSPDNSTEPGPEGGGGAKYWLILSVANDHSLLYLRSASWSSHV